MEVGGALRAKRWGVERINLPGGGGLVAVGGDVMLVDELVDGTQTSLVDDFSGGDVVVPAVIAVEKHVERPVVTRADTWIERGLTLLPSTKGRVEAVHGIFDRFAKNGDEVEEVEGVASSEVSLGLKLLKNLDVSDGGQIEISPVPLDGCGMDRLGPGDVVDRLIMERAVEVLKRNNGRVRVICPVYVTDSILDEVPCGSPVNHSGKWHPAVGHAQNFLIEARVFKATERRDKLPMHGAAGVTVNRGEKLEAEASKFLVLVQMQSKEPAHAIVIREATDAPPRLTVGLELAERPLDSASRQTKRRPLGDNVGPKRSSVATM